MSRSLFIHHVRAAIRRAEVHSGMDALGSRARVLLDMIGENDGKLLRIGEVAALSRLGTPPTIYKAISELERGGWIDRIEDYADRRTSLLRLSAKARRAYAKMSREAAQLTVE